MNNIVQQLDKLSKEIETAKRNVSQYEGQEIQLTKQLNDLGFYSVEEAEKEIIKMEKEIKLKTQEIEEGFAELKDQYDW
jgi:hypothetical protein